MGAAPRAAILVTGDEILRGRIQERNAGILSRSLEGHGVEIARIEVVGDGRAAIATAVARLLEEGHDLLCISGGLGPTHDDLTMQAVGDAIGRPLAVDPRALAMVRARSAGIRSDRAVQEELHEKQASLPAGSILLAPAGTAPGCIVGHEGVTLVVLPGPPWELSAMWETAISVPAVARIIACAERASERILRVHAVPESSLVATIDGIDPDVWNRLTVGICAREGELEITVRSAPDDVWAADALEARIAEGVGRSLFSRDGATIDDVVAAGLIAADQTIAVAESCTGGGLGARLSARAGASRYLLGGVIAYADAVKLEALGVAPEVIRRHGAVSAECAEQMAVGVRHRLGSDWALSITGIAGPDGGSADKPVGLVFIALAGPSGVRHIEHRRGGDREAIRDRAVAGALHLLRQGLADSVRS